VRFGVVLLVLGIFGMRPGLGSIDSHGQMLPQKILILLK